jgi:hypothetical protein
LKVNISGSTPGNSKGKIKEFIGELKGEVTTKSKLLQKKAALKELEDAFAEAKKLRTAKNRV